jgi:membrane-associated phospholipid phosphatase
MPNPQTIKFLRDMKFITITMLSACLSGISGNAAAQGVFSTNQWDQIEKGAIPFLAFGTIRDRSYSLSIGSTVTGAFLANDYLLKPTFRVQRPNNQGFGFPSSHALTTFAVASAQSTLHPDESAYWYLGASLISISRVSQQQHSWSDIGVGAALGYFMGKFATSSRAPFKTQLTPHSLSLIWEF